MKAYVLERIGDIRLKNTKKPVPKEDEVTVRIKACGICGSDIPRIYQNGAHRMPLVLGHEFSGEVTEIGKKANERFLYKRVGVFPMIPCRECAACRIGKYELCRNYSYLGSRRDGGFAEYAVVPAANLIELPDAVSFKAAAMLEPMAVAVHAMRRTLPCMEDRIAVCGLGTIGLLLAAFLKDAGFQHIFLIGNKDFQKETAFKLGFSKDQFCDGRKENVSSWIMERTIGAGADVFFECAGRNETIAEAIDLAAVSGKVCLVGNPFTDIRIPRDVYWKILKNQLTVTGTWNSSFTGETGDDWQYVMKRLSEKKMIPESMITHRFPIEKLEEGFRIMRDKTQDYIKIMGVFDG